MSVNHYENFPVASLLCPRVLRPDVVAIYNYARTADDLADEGSASPEQRIAELSAYEADLHVIAAGGAPSPRWREVFEPLALALHRRNLPVPLLADLLSAFKQDVVQHEYADRDTLLDYCRRSANPIGRLLLHMYGVDDAGSLRQSDLICTALQLANFWQDLSVDTQRGRLYIPLIDCERLRVSPGELLARRDSPGARALVAEMVQWTGAMMIDGAPLAHRLRGGVGWELRLVVQGGLRILRKIERMQHASLMQRPRLRWHDVPAMMWYALQLRANASQPLQGRP